MLLNRPSRAAPRRLLPAQPLSTQSLSALTLPVVAALACLGTALGPVPATAQTATQTATPTHDHAQDHSHNHDHAADEKARQVYKGYFEDAEVAPRPLSDWAGDWQSVYPLLTGGALDPVMAHKAQHGDKSAAEYRASYEIGYKTDVDRIEIDGDTVTFHRPSGPVSATYEDDGYEILTYKKGNRGVRFSFRKVSGDADAPGFIQFSDHNIAPRKVGHYHLYWGDDRDAVLAELTNWPTYFPSTMPAQDIAQDMMAH